MRGPQKRYNNITLNYLKIKQLFACGAIITLYTEDKLRFYEKIHL